MTKRKTISAFWLRCASNRGTRYAVLAAGLFGLGWLGACAGQIPHPSAAQRALAAERWPGLGPEELEKGRFLYIARCSGCHPLPLPTQHTAGEWPAVVDRMALNARLTAAEVLQITRYLVTVRTDIRTPP